MYGKPRGLLPSDKLVQKMHLTLTPGPHNKHSQRASTLVSRVLILTPCTLEFTDLSTSEPQLSKTVSEIE